MDSSIKSNILCASENLNTNQTISDGVDPTASIGDQIVGGTILHKSLLLEGLKPFFPVNISAVSPSMGFD